MARSGVIRFDYALVNGQPLHISQLESNRGKPHKDKVIAICIGCGGEMIPRIGEVNEPHFAHKSGCQCNFESYEHKAAKLLVQTGLLAATRGEQDVFIINNYRLNAILQLFLKGTCEIKQEVTLTCGGRADVAIIRDGEVVFVIEVFHTHMTEPGRRPDMDWIEVSAHEVLGNVNRLRARNWSARPQPVAIPLRESQIELVVPLDVAPTAADVLSATFLSEAGVAFMADVPLLAEVDQQEKDKLAALDREREAAEQQRRMDQCTQAQAARIQLEARQRNGQITLGGLAVLGLAAIFEPPRRCPRNSPPLVHLLHGAWKLVHSFARSGQ